MTTYTPQKQDGNNRSPGENRLIVYFSATGTTETVAKTLAAVTSGALCKITPTVSYTAADLDWNDRQSRSSVEMRTPDARPSIKETHVNIDDYDTLFIGYPIWWDLAPRVINTFIESHTLTGKAIIPFATSGGSGIGNSVAQLKKAYPKLRWKSGRLLNHADKTTLREWAETVM